MTGSSPGNRWNEVIADSDTTATEYRDRGWTAVALHPGDVNPISDGARLDVLLPGSEFEAVSEVVATADIDTVRVYAGTDEAVQYRLVVAEDEAESVAVCVPTFVDKSKLNALQFEADAQGGLTLRLRPLDDRDVVEIDVPDPAVFFDPSPTE
jgi:hypothetical protein